MVFARGMRMKSRLVGESVREHLPNLALCHAVDLSESDLSLNPVDAELSDPRASVLRNTANPRRSLKQETGLTAAEVFPHCSRCLSSEQNNSVLIALSAMHADNARLAPRDVLDAK